MDEMPNHCSFLCKLTEDNLYVSHTAWFIYIMLLRMYKVVHVELRNPLVRTKRMSYSSCPGYATSVDDFYIMDNNKFVSETTLGSSNSEVFDWIHY